MVTSVASPHLGLHGKPGSGCSIFFGVTHASSFPGGNIPTNAVMIGGGNGSTIGLSVTQRYTSPGLSSDGAGTWWAAPGNSSGGANNNGFATWNFDYYVREGTASPTDYFTPYVDLNPAVGNALNTLTAYSPTAAHSTRPTCATSPPASTTRSLASIPSRSISMTRTATRSTTWR